MPKASRPYFNKTEFQHSHLVRDGFNKKSGAQQKNLIPLKILVHELTFNWQTIKLNQLRELFFLKIYVEKSNLLLVKKNYVLNF